MIHERVLGWVVPVRPYRCQSCEFRQWGLIDPLVSRERLISWSVLGLVAILFILNSVLVFPVDGDAPEDDRDSQQIATQAEEGERPDEVGTSDKASDEEPSKSGETPEAEAPRADSGQVPAGEASSEPVVEVKDTAPEPSSVPAKEATGVQVAQSEDPAAATAEPSEPEVSPFVAKQREKNMAKRNGGKGSSEKPAEATPKRVSTPSPQKARPSTKANTEVAAATGSKETRQDFTVPPASGKTPPPGYLRVIPQLRSGTLTIDLNAGRPMADPKVLDSLISSRKLIIDFPGSYKVIPDEYRVNHRRIRTVRTGIHPTHVRVVLDLASTDHPRPVIDQTPSGARIRIQ
ncbi:AMIN domain-containing protein [Sulfidibacter corallicola]|uniref:AMIN domain-containing protein n=1 Tax=Sulfidibacter corallicola TaxID=2818388 RepID=A0A8A4U1K0_SULCO|nr:AMIN domain-containing protein [Sulfidibacter corallicola]QTD52615.1 AMIN domain-containing protein [Sulfidibacter corallicola]